MKQLVRDHWQRETCGIRYAESKDGIGYFREIRSERYRLEPWIPAFQQADRCAGLQVLEIGLGAGSDFLAWAEAGADAYGIDLTKAAVERTREHLELEGARSERFLLSIPDAEALPFGSDSFDLVYSYGVLHHTPDTILALAEISRVLRSGGSLRIMLYHCRSWTVLMMWILHGLLRGKPFVSPRRAVFEHLESPGTKCFSTVEVREMLRRNGFRDIAIELRLGPGDLLTIRPSERYRSPFHRLLWRIYPRPLLRLLGNGFGLIMLIEAKKR